MNKRRKTATQATIEENQEKIRAGYKPVCLLQEIFPEILNGGNYDTLL